MAKTRILIVDDEQGFLRMLKLGLEETGAYVVRTEHQAAKGLSAAREFRPELILVDVIMPEMDGGDIVGQLEADEAVKDIPVVFVTAVVQKGEVGTTGSKIGGYDFLAKPVGVKGVLECIEKRLGKPSAIARPLSGGKRKKRITIIDNEDGDSRS